MFNLSNTGSRYVPNNGCKMVIRERRTNHLELFLKDIYRHELKYKIEKDEVKFIQNGLECLVKSLAKVIDIEAKNDIEAIKIEYQGAFPSMVVLRNTGKVVGVGSYYERTKNGYPDEFDFNYVLFTFYSEGLSNTKYATFGYTHDPSFKKVHNTLRHMLSIKSLRDRLFYEENGRMIRFESYDEQVGPTSKLLFSYRVGKNLRILNVDLTLAVRRVDPQLDNRELHPDKQFMDAIVQTGSFLYVNDKMTFPETEVYVMKYIVSRKHRKACRILKYLVNGHKDGHILAKRLRQVGHFGEIISSNMIKTEIILHHFKCNRADKELYPCVLEILESIENYDNDTPLQTLTAEKVHAHLFRSVDRMRYLEGMISTLWGMMESTQPYVYEKDRISPIARSLLVYPKPHIVQYSNRNMLDGFWCVGTYCYHFILCAFSVFMVVMFISVLIYSWR